MGVAKHIEITAASPQSFEDAIRIGIKRANQTVEDVCQVWVKEQKVVVENGSPKEYRVDMKVTFMIHE